MWVEAPAPGSSNRSGPWPAICTCQRCGPLTMRVESSGRLHVGRSRSQSIVQRGSQGFAHPLGGRAGQRQICAVHFARQIGEIGLRAGAEVKNETWQSHGSDPACHGFGIASGAGAVGATVKGDICATIGQDSQDRAQALRPGTVPEFRGGLKPMRQRRATATRKCGETAFGLDKRTGGWQEKLGLGAAKGNERNMVAGGIGTREQQFDSPLGFAEPGQRSGSGSVDGEDDKAVGLFFVALQVNVGGIDADRTVRLFAAKRLPWGGGAERCNQIEAGGAVETPGTRRKRSPAAIAALSLPGACTLGPRTVPGGERGKKIVGAGRRGRRRSACLRAVRRSPSVVQGPIASPALREGVGPVPEARLHGVRAPVRRRRGCRLCWVRSARAELHAGALRARRIAVDAAYRCQGGRRPVSGRRSRAGSCVRFSSLALTAARRACP